MSTTNLPMSNLPSPISSNQSEESFTVDNVLKRKRKHISGTNSATGSDGFDSATLQQLENTNNAILKTIEKSSGHSGDNETEHYCKSLIPI